MARLFAAFLSAFFLFFSSASAQTEELQRALDNPYVASALEIMELVRNGEVTFDQADLYRQIVDRASAARGSGLTIESEILPDIYDSSALEERFFTLPPIEEWPPISTGARLLVAASILDVADQLEGQGIQPTVEDLLPMIGPSMYLMLASAAAEAGAEPRIDVISARRGGVLFFSLGWPFCCAE